MPLIKALTKNVSDDFKLTTVPLPEVLLRDHRHTTNADSFKVFIAVLMIAKNSSDFIGGKVVKHILSKELAGVDINAEDRVTPLVKRLGTTGLFKADFIQMLMDSDLKQLSGNVDIWNSFFKTECTLLEEGKGEDTANPATEGRRQSRRKGATRAPTATKATAETDTEQSEKKERTKRSNGGSCGDTKKQRKKSHRE